MTDETPRSVRIERTSLGHYQAHNVRGGSLEFATGDDNSFTPVELLLVALGGCGAIDVDHITAKRAEPTEFTVTVTGDKVSDVDGNHMTNLQITFQLEFPDGAAGDAAREVLPRAIVRSHDRLCTVSRTVELGTPVIARAADRPETGGPS